MEPGWAKAMDVDALKLIVDELRLESKVKLLRLLLLH